MFKVLLVEDDPVESKNLRRKLSQKPGFEAIRFLEASNLQSAINILIEETDIVAVFVDLSIPGIDKPNSLEAYHKIRPVARSNGIEEIVILTGMDDDAIEREIKKINARCIKKYEIAKDVAPIEKIIQFAIARRTEGNNEKFSAFDKRLRDVECIVYELRALNTVVAKLETRQERILDTLHGTAGTAGFDDLINNLDRSIQELKKKSEKQEHDVESVKKSLWVWLTLVSILRKVGIEKAVTPILTVMVGGWIIQFGWWLYELLSKSGAAD